MAEATLELDDLLAQWSTMPAGDRKAIRKRLPMERRIALDRVLATHKAAALSEAAGSFRREHAAYSPWLAEIVAACETDGGGNCTLTPAVRDAIRAAHHTAIAAQPAEPAKPSLLDLARAALRQWSIWP
ncbi:MAG: hypothetical protein PHE36_08605 [Novosphingobium sp.]|nr:hypothetical protein [Novosphingobium sp.]